MTWGIHTVYLPRENLRFIEEWLAYHTLLGASYFHLYDNTGSTELIRDHSIAVTGKNSYELPADFFYSDDDIEEIQNEIFRKYPVTKIKWQPRREDGQIHYGQVPACDHFSESMKSTRRAFIDMDEFICSPYVIEDSFIAQAIILEQKKFDDRNGYDTALEVTKTFSFNTKGMGPKVFIDMAHYRTGHSNVHSLYSHLRVPILRDFSGIRINHYNHGEYAHRWLLDWYHIFDPSWTPVAYEDVFTERDDGAAAIAPEIDYSRFVQAALRKPPSFVRARP
jgi:hypothetical protein